MDVSTGDEIHLLDQDFDTKGKILFFIFLFIYLFIILFSSDLQVYFASST